MAASPTSEDKKPTLGEVIESIGIGPAQFRAGLLGGGVWLADGAELLLIGSVADTLAREWHLSSFTKGFVVTIVYTGLMFGNITSGPAGARFGRREVVVLSFFGRIFVFSIFSSTSQSITDVLMIWRFIVGWSIGFGQPAWLAISAEITPAKYRIITGGLTQTLFALGELYSASLLMLDDPSLQKLDWRRVIALGAIPSAILFIFSALFLHQSPTFLQMKGRHADAVQVLESMRHDNSAPDISVDFRLQPQNAPQLGFIETFYRQSKVIMSNKLLVPTLVTMFTCFELNLAYYGCIYAFPQVLSDLVAEQLVRE
ncbi:unnamed protein product [Effrenium voratum]|uniref:Major facilitator superfamily (MFS) profile domain-containing protein n=1 Tax=Effrenium voratum TaxID=2562239 RepID=A0AA36JPB8_9DINO|nr:unnamed protein product [Effrenium voratum]